MIQIPQKKSELVEMLDKLTAMNNPDFASSIKYIELILKDVDAGIAECASEGNANE